jgi:hypothetical protein
MVEILLEKLLIETIKPLVPGTIKRQKRHFVRVKGTKNLNFVERKSQKHMI